ncbi:MAG: regulatory protein RecX [Gemmatimonadaceae bacterium]|nr:regulatory protein RecX [Gemmatimonadaceae bacterium]MDQ3244611.1 recombination regulator RecX [Gemmatimonadota bacterium]
MSHGKLRSAHDQALSLLTARAYSVGNLRRKLVLKQYPADEVSSVIERLMKSGLLDDERFAEQFVRGRLPGKGASRVRLKQQLFQRGISAEIAETAIDQVMNDEPVDTQSMVIRAARKKLTSMSNLEPVVQRRRLYAYLGRAGYKPDEIRLAMLAAFEPE